MANDRDCPHCIYHDVDGCTSWDCEQVTRSEARKRLKNGKWGDPGREYGRGYLKCSNCGEVVFLAMKFNFCPHCGAKMEQPDA